MSVPERIRETPERDPSRPHLALVPDDDEAAVKTPAPGLLDEPADDELDEESGSEGDAPEAAT